MISNFSFPTSIKFGPGARKLAVEELNARALSRPLVVTDKGVAEQPFFKDFVNMLADSGLKPQVYSGIYGNPVKSQVTNGTDFYKLAGSDCIIAVGGGAALDVSKAIALMVNHPGDVFDYEDGKPDGRPVDQEIPFLVAMPTTAGTGSEVGRSAVVSDEETHIKKIIFSPKLLPALVLADPELTTGLPASVTAATGMDALTHLIEAYLAKGFHPICDGIALEGLKLGAENLMTCVQEPDNLEARSAMLVASMMGAIAFQKGLGLTHSCAHALSTVADLHHGLANGIMVDYALKHNLEAVPERFEALAAAVGLKEQTGEAFLDWLRILKKEIGIPSRLSEVNVKKEQLERLTEVAVADACHQCNPRDCTREDFAGIFAEAL